MADKDFRVKNRLHVNGLSQTSGVILATNNALDAHTNVPTQYGGTGTTQSPNAGQVLFSSAGTNYVPTTLTSLDVKGATYSADAPASPVVGQVWIESDSSSDSFDPNIIRRKTITATAGQTTFTTDLEFIQGYEQVYFNGMLLLRTSDYTTPSNTSVVLAAAAAAGDIVEILSITNLNSINAATTTTNTFTGNQIFQAQVGMGSSNPGGAIGDERLRVVGTDTNGWPIAVEDSAGTVAGGFYAASNLFGMGTASTDPITLITANTERMRIDASGGVGIGTSSIPNWVKVDIASTGILRHTYTGSPAGVLFGQYDVNGQAYILNQANNALMFGTNNTEKMRIQANGDVILSNTDSNALRYLDIYNTNTGGNAGAIIRFITNNNANTAVTTADIVKYRNGDWNFNNGDSAGKIQFYQTDSTKMFINSSGNIGMSNNFFTADAKLHIASVSSLARGMQISLADGSFAGDGVLLVASRTSTSAFNYLRARSDGSADNEFILRGDGIGYSDGGWTTPAADYAEYFEWEDGNINDDDRRGYTVSLVDNKIKIAEEGEDVIGVVSANPSFVGDAHNDHWQGKYLLDEFGSEIKEAYEVITWKDLHDVKHGYEVGSVPEEIEVPEEHIIVTQYRSVLNPNYDPEQEYIGRENRKEWDTIGVVGKLRVRKGQIVNPRWIKMRDISETVEEWFVR